MNTQDDLEEYRGRITQKCAAAASNVVRAHLLVLRLGKGCGIERHLPALVELCRTTNSALIDPYIEKLHDTICADCEYKDNPMSVSARLSVAACRRGGGEGRRSADDSPIHCKQCGIDSATASGTMMKTFQDKT